MCSNNFGRRVPFSQVACGVLRGKRLRHQIDNEDHVTVSTYVWDRLLVELTQDDNESPAAEAGGQPEMAVPRYKPIRSGGRLGGGLGGRGGPGFRRPRFPGWGGRRVRGVTLLGGGRGEPQGWGGCTA